MAAQRQLPAFACHTILFVSLDMCGSVMLWELTGNRLSFLIFSCSRLTQIYMDGNRRENRRKGSRSQFVRSKSGSNATLCQTLSTAQNCENRLMPTLRVQTNAGRVSPYSFLSLWERPAYSLYGIACSFSFFSFTRPGWENLYVMPGHSKRLERKGELIYWLLLNHCWLWVNRYAFNDWVSTASSFSSSSRHS